MNLQKTPAMLPETERSGVVSAWIPFDKAKAGLNIMEIWKDIKDYEGLYQVSNSGRIKSLERYVNHRLGVVKFVRERIKKQYKDRVGYKSVMLSKNGKQIRDYVHRLVGFAFVENPFNKPDINHKNGIKYDNRFINIEWVTKSENSLHMCHVLGIRPSLGRVHSEETKKKIGEARKGRKHLEETKRKIASARTKLTKNQKIEIKAKYKIGNSVKSLTKEYNVSVGPIYNVINGRKSKWE